MSDHNVSPLPIGHMLQEYRIERVLGHGGFGVTYLARDRYLNALVAIKEFLPRETAQREPSGQVRPRSAELKDDYAWGLDRFMREARALARFKHPNIVRVARMIEANGTAYMVMEYEHGQTLSEYLKRAAVQLAEPELLGIFVPLIDGLAALHRLDLIHRDIKPGNIYLRREGPMLLDFGAARQMVAESDDSTLTTLVTPGYAPLEQYSSSAGVRQGPWSDAYALGATMYRCMFGVAPVVATARSAAIGEGDADPYEPATLRGAGRFSPGLLEAVDWSLALRVKDRPQSVVELKQRLLAGGVQPAPLAIPIDEVEDEATVKYDPSLGSARSETAAPTSTLVLSPSQGGRPRPWWRSQWVAGGALLAIAALAGTMAWQRAVRDDAAFAVAQAANTIDAYRGYTESCARCAHWDEALRRLAALERAAAADRVAPVAPTVAAAPATVTTASVAAAASDDKPKPKPEAAGPKPRPGPPAGQRIRDKLAAGGEGPELVVIGAGSFEMGDATGHGNRDEEPVHRVAVARFALGVREVTRGEFGAFVTATGYETEAQRAGSCRISRRGGVLRDRWSNWKRMPFSQSDAHPVVCVTLADAEAYAAWLSKQTKRRYRLPTEAEWEYAARAGSRGDWWWGEAAGDGHANCDGCGEGARDRPLETGSFAANPWGLFDVAGNVAEWTCSAHTRRYEGEERVCASSGSLRDRVVRGGAWTMPPTNVRSAFRGAAPTETAIDTVGFRIAAET